jgi:hypothetical protein
MKFSFKSFAVGFGCAALSLGAVTYANAAGNGTLKACANKTTGAMRYISKGSCKKTETSLSWSQMGPQGLPGVAGSKGDSGTAGTAGTDGANGINGKNFHVIDATGRDLGEALGTSSGGNSADILYDGGIWAVEQGRSIVSGSLIKTNFFSDSLCTNHLMASNTSTSQSVSISSMARGWNGDSTNPKYYKATGPILTRSTTPNFGITYTRPVDSWVLTCTPSSSVLYQTTYPINADSYSYFTAVVEVTPPAYTAPFTLVAK